MQQNRGGSSIEVWGGIQERKLGGAEGEVKFFIATPK